MPTPSVCVRSVSPRGTLPRASAKRRSIRPPSVVLPAHGNNNEPKSEPVKEKEAGNVPKDADVTPRASTHDLRDPEESGASSATGSASLTSSIHKEKEEEDGDGDPGSSSGTLSRTLRSVTGVKAKRIRFYRNGDQYFKGLPYALRADRLRSLKPLLEDLTKALSDSTALPHGVRHIFTIDGSARITELDQFEHGESYVCSSTETFKQMDYLNAREPFWSVGLAKPERPIDVAQLALHNYHHTIEPNDFVYPRIITVIRNGVKPRRVVRHLLNKKTARSFTQVINDLTAVVKLDSGAIKKLFGLTGRLVTTLSQFFEEDDVFIAYGNERTNSDDFFVASEEYARLYSHSRTRQRPRRVMPARNESLREDRSGVHAGPEVPRLPPLLDAQMEITRLLGDGNTALVYETKDLDTEQRHALKWIAPENIVGKKELIESEICLMRRLSHPHIVLMNDCWRLDGGYFLLLELVQDGDLFEYLCQARRLNERTASRLTRNLAEALAYLHQRRIVHRDVKPENLLLYHNSRGELQLKLADFGLATELPEGGTLSTICGTPTYVAAEVLAEWGYDEKVDVWATGVILYVMLCGFPPFQSASGEQEELFAQILEGVFGFPSPAWDRISASAKALILSAINIDVDERVSAEEILSNEWIRTGGEVAPEHEAMAQLIVENRVGVVDDQEVEETDREYYLSRRTSMDELSEGRSASGEFTFCRKFSR